MNRNNNEFDYLFTMRGFAGAAFAVGAAFCILNGGFTGSIINALINVALYTIVVAVVGLIGIAVGAAVPTQENKTWDTIYFLGAMLVMTFVFAGVGKYIFGSL